ncbi:MAG: hypothetical protein V1806_05760 [Pseudomonadota bacterium]
MSDAETSAQPAPTYEELLAERNSLRREAEVLRGSAFCYIYGPLSRMARLEEERDQRIAHLLAAASSPQVSLDVVMELLTESARTIHDQTVHAILYEIQPMTGKTLGWIKENEALQSLDDVSLKEVLFCKVDSRVSCLGGSMDEVPVDQRYLSVKQGTVVAEAFMRRQPVVSIPEEGIKDRLEGAHYGHYDRSRWTHVDQRAAFPLINPLSSQVEYVLVIDKGGEPLSNYDIRYVRDYVNLASFALAIKKILADDRALLDHLRKGLHDLGSAMQSVQQLGGLILDMLEFGQLQADKLKEYRQRLGWQFDRFARLIQQLRTGSFQYDLEPRELDGLVARFVASVSDQALYGSRVRFSLDLGAPGQMVMVDAFVLQAALENMAKNTFETDKPATARITTSRQGDYVKLTYFDDCGGMDERLYWSVIERGKAPSTKAQGSGLGIQSILNSLRGMGCIVGAVNRPGQGFGYEALIPLAAAE